LCDILSDERMGLSLMNILGFCDHIYCTSLKILSFAISKSSVIPDYAMQIMPVLYIFATTAEKSVERLLSLAASRYKQLIFSVFGSPLPYDANMAFLVILEPSRHMLVEIFNKCETQFFLLISIFFIFCCCNVLSSVSGLYTLHDMSNCRLGSVRFFITTSIHIRTPSVV
jgi:hypothetical protein